MTRRDHMSTRGLLAAVGLLAATVGLVQLFSDGESDRPEQMTPAAARIGPSASASAVDVSAVSQTGSAGVDDSWAHLSAAQRQALEPIRQVWPKLDGNARRTWLAIASDFRSKPKAIQDRMHARMAQWSKLSSSQRAAARLRYLQTAKLNRESKRERWQAYEKMKPELRQPVHAANEVEVVPPASLKGRPGATTVLMPVLVGRTHGENPGAD